MNIENHGDAEELRNDGSKNQKIGDRMHVNQLVVLREMASSHRKRGHEQKSQDSEEICKWTALIHGPRLQPKYIDPVEAPAHRLARLPQCDYIDRISALHQSGRILLDPGVRLVER